MDQQTRSQCQHSLDLLVGREDDFAQAFFSLLFERAPEFRVLFAKDIDDPKVRTTTMIRMAVTFVSDQTALSTKLRVLGFRMAMRGMSFEHYEVFSKTLIGSLKRTLRQSWQTDFDHAWREVEDEALSALAAGAELMAA